MGVIRYAISVLKQHFWLLIAKRDVNGYNAFEFGLQFLEPKRLTECYVCTRRDLWNRITRKLKTGFGNVSDIMTSQEFSAFLIINYAFQNGFDVRIFRNHFNQILSKSDVLATALLEYLQESPYDFTDQIVLSIRNGMHPISFLTLARYKPEWLHQCDKHLNSSPLHMLMQNADRDIFFPLQLLYSKASKNIEIFSNRNLYEHSNQIFRRIFGYAGQFDRQFLSCATTEGLNLLHVALLHGNLQATHHFLLYGISIFNDRITVPVFFSLSMFSRLRFEIPQTLYEVPDQANNKTKLTETEYLDFIVAICFQKAQSHMILADICNEEKHELSLSHFAAVNGLTRFLRALYKRFGSKVLTCRNKDRVTPLYLAKIFGQIETVNFLESKAQLKFPKRKIEGQLLFHILHKIDVQNVSDPWHCLLKHKIRWWSLSSLSRYYACILKALRKINDFFPKFKLTITFKNPEYKDVQWKKVKNEADTKLDILKSTFNFLTYIQMREGSDETADYLAEKLIEDIKALIEIMEKTKTITFTLMRLTVAKKWLAVHKKTHISSIEYKDRLRVLLQYVAFSILLETRDALVVKYALFIPYGLLGYDNIVSSESGSFLNARIDKIKPFLENNLDTFTRNVLKYYYLDVLRKTVGFKSMERTLMPSSIAKAVSSVRTAKPYDGSKDPLRDMSVESRLKDFVVKDTNQDT